MNVGFPCFKKKAFSGNIGAFTHILCRTGVIAGYEVFMYSGLSRLTSYTCRFRVSVRVFGSTRSSRNVKEELESTANKSS